MGGKGANKKGALKTFTKGKARSFMYFSRESALRLII